MNTSKGEKILSKNPRINEPEYLTSASKLFLKRRENHELSKLLSNEKEEYSLKVEGLHKGFEELADKEQELEMSLVKFDGFLRDNNQKRERAMKKMQAEEIKCKTLSEEIEKTRLALARRIDKRRRLDKRLKYYSLFSSYLSSVLAASEGYGEISDLVNRVEALKALKIELKEKELESQEIIEDLRRALSLQKCEKTENVLDRTNCVVALQRSYSTTQSEIFKREGQWNATQDVLAKNNKILSILKVSAKNLHNILAKIQKDGQVVPDENPQTHLKRVKEYLLSLEDLVTTLERTTED